MSIKKNILIIGAGPAGLACAHELSINEENKYKVDVLESQEQVGGLSKTVEFDGYYYDLGPHRFFSKIKEVNDLWSKTLRKGFLTKKRLTRIYYKGKFYDYPIEIINTLSNLGLFESIRIGFSFLKIKLFPSKEENNFEQFVTNKFGKRLYQTFFENYTEKIWGISGKKISAEWGSQRIKGLSLISVLLAKLPWNKNKVKSLINEFKYPKYGPGMMYKSMKTNIEKNKKFKILLSTKLVGLSYKDNKWKAMIDRKGVSYTKKYDHVISTMPLTQLILGIDHDVPKDIMNIASKLKFRSIILVCMVFDKQNKLKDKWIYLHDKSIKSSRLQILNNWSSFMVKNKNHSSYSCEYFCTEGDVVWKRSSKGLVDLAVAELKQSKLIPVNYECLKGNVIRIKKAYPVYDGFYSRNMPSLIRFIKQLPNLQVIGRGGMFRYNNMDHSIYTGMLAARNLIKGKQEYDLWSVNQDEEYYE